MATVQISVEEYLRTSYHPDCDYVDGEVQERNLGEFDHAAVQMFLGNWFFQHRQEWQLHVLPEMRIRVSGRRVRIADLCLMARSQPVEQVLTQPPLAAIEILSPEDTVTRMMTKLNDYERMGIRTILIVDPNGRSFRYSGGSLEPLPSEAFDLPGSACRFDLAEIEKLLD